MARVSSQQSLSTPALTLKQKAEAIRAARAAAQPAPKGESVFDAVGVGFGEFINGFGRMRDAYTVTRAERK